MNDLMEPADEEHKAEKTDSDGGQEDRFLPSEQRQAAVESRRSEEDRRQDGDSFEGEEKRETPDRRSSRDRRRIGLEVTCKTTGSVTNIEDWLDDNCDSNWKVVLQKIDRDLVIKHLKVMFETESDRDKFLDKYLGVGQ